MDNELEADMPMAVKRQMPDYDPSQEPDLKSDFLATATMEQVAILTPKDMSIDVGMVPEFN